MIIIAAMLASAPALPWLDRSWLNDRARIEASVGSGEGRVKAAPRPVPATGPSARKPVGEAEINGM